MICISDLQTHFKGFNISEIIKAGSLGDGTAVIGNYDIDLVVYSRGIYINIYSFLKNLYTFSGFTGRDVLLSPTMFQPWLSQLKQFIDRIQGFTLKYPRSVDRLSVQFSYEVSHGLLIDVDLLVSPYWNEPQDFYDFLRQVPRDDRQSLSVQYHVYIIMIATINDYRYSVCASKWQRQFFSRLENQVCDIGQGWI